ncbi:MAG: riboflavin synthase [Elusimicrobia bacterium]|nr:riboflavin synthase [Elusimicrobiota bacterium]
MFQGIIEGVGIVKFFKARRLKIKLPRKWAMRRGESLAVNGVCLSVVQKYQNMAEFDAGQETIQITNLGRAKAGDRVNLERSLKFGQRISGHLVLGHVDAMAQLKGRRRQGNSLIFEILVEDQSLCVVPKGSIAIDGISLTINRVARSKKRMIFDVCLIPETVKRTALGFRRVGDWVNIETDYLARAVIDRDFRS